MRLQTCGWLGCNLILPDIVIMCANDHLHVARQQFPGGLVIHLVSFLANPSSPPFPRVVNASPTHRPHNTVGSRIVHEARNFGHFPARGTLLLIVEDVLLNLHFPVASSNAGVDAWFAVFFSPRLDLLCHSNESTTKMENRRWADIPQETLACLGVAIV